MKCAECEQLFDAYLDGELSGSLRLEFDAHRLRCQRCQRSLAAMEAIGSVLGGDRDVPDLPSDFTHRVMNAVERPRTVRFPLLRGMIVAAAVAQAAAVLVVVLFSGVHPADDTSGSVGAELGPKLVELDEDPGRAAITQLVAEGVEDKLWSMHAAGLRLTTDLKQLARYLDVTIPEDLARDSGDMAKANPWQGVLESVIPDEEEKSNPADPAEEIHSI